MRLFILILALPVLLSSAFAEGYDPRSFPSYAALPPLAKPWFENIAQSFAYHNELVKLAKVPEAEPAMTELMQRIISDPMGNPELLHYVIQSIELRDDFSEDHQAWLRDLLLSKLGTTDGYMESILKMYGPDIFIKYPSQANEDLMIKYLGDKDVLDVVPGALDLGHSLTAMRVLGKIGTERAIKPLQKYAEIFKPEPGEEADTSYFEILKGIESIKERAKRRPAMAPDADATTNGNAEAIQKQGASTQDESHEADTGMLWLILLVPALLALFWQFWAKRK